LDNSELEIDLELLEDMCSEMEEPVFLVNGARAIVWVNKVLKEKLGAIGRDPSDKSRYVLGVYSLFGLDLETDDKLKASLSKGRFSRSIVSNNSDSYKCIYMPIKYSHKTVYVLAIIEDRHNKPAADTHLGSHGMHGRILRHFLKDTPYPCIFVSPDRSVIIANKKFDSEFEKSAVLKNLIVNAMNEKSAYALKYLKSLLSLSHDVTLKTIREDKSEIGTVYNFRKARKK
jgi:hypothetical protein